MPPTSVEFDPAPHEYRIDGQVVPSVTQILKAERAIRYFGNAEEARLRGQAVHELTRLWDENDVGDYDERLQPYLDAWIEFRKSTGFKPLLIEGLVAHPIYRYCGTFDRLGEFADGRLALIDLKTGEDETWHELQTAAYLAAARHTPIAREVIGRRKVIRGAALLTKSARQRFEPHRDDADEATFLSFVAVHSWKKKWGIQ